MDAFLKNDRVVHSMTGRKLPRSSSGDEPLPYFLTAYARYDPPIVGTRVHGPRKAPMPRFSLAATATGLRSEGPMPRNSCVEQGSRPASFRPRVSSSGVTVTKSVFVSTFLGMQLESTH